MSETYKDGEIVDGTQEGPVIHGLEGGASGTVRAMAISSSGAGTVVHSGPISALVHDGSGNAIGSTGGALDNYITNDTIQQTTTVDHDSLNVVMAGVTTDTTGTVEPLKMNAEKIQYTVAWNDLVPEKVDNISLAYDGSTLTSVVYVYSSVTQATLTLAYDGDNLTSVVKT